MGNYLPSPNANKISADHESDGLRYASCAMQGWRCSMEDAHLIQYFEHLECTKGPALICGVYDGHGGRHVASFVARHFVDVLFRNEDFQRGRFDLAFRTTYVNLDQLLWTAQRELLWHQQQANPQQQLPTRRKPLRESLLIGDADGGSQPPRRKASPLGDRRQVSTAPPGAASASSALEDHGGGNNSVPTQQESSMFSPKVVGIPSPYGVIEQTIVSGVVVPDNVHPSDHEQTQLADPAAVASQTTLSSSSDGGEVDALETAKSGGSGSENAGTTSAASSEMGGGDGSTSAVLWENVVTVTKEEAQIVLERIQALRVPSPKSGGSPPGERSHTSKLSSKRTKKKKGSYNTKGEPITLRAASDAYSTASRGGVSALWRKSGGKKAATVQPSSLSSHLDTDNYDFRAASRMTGELASESGCSPGSNVGGGQQTLSSTAQRGGDGENREASGSHSGSGVVTNFRCLLPADTAAATSTALSIGGSSPSPPTSSGFRSFLASILFRNKPHAAIPAATSTPFAVMSPDVLESVAGNHPASHAGCTAVTVMVTNHKIVVANAGDSRAVLCRSAAAVELSKDHKPNNPVEKARIYSAGGWVEVGRVNGNLNLSRAMGDLHFKTIRNLPPEKQVVSCVPDVVIAELQPFDEFIIIGCDGIWEASASQEIVDFIRQRIDTATTLSSILEELLDELLSPNPTLFDFGCDNMTAILIDLRPEKRPRRSASSKQHDTVVAAVSEGGGPSPLRRNRQPQCGQRRAPGGVVWPPRQPSDTAADDFGAAPPAVSSVGHRGCSAAAAAAAAAAVRKGANQHQQDERMVGRQQIMVGNTIATPSSGGSSGSHNKFRSFLPQIPRTKSSSSRFAPAANATSSSSPTLEGGSSRSWRRRRLHSMEELPLVPSSDEALFPDENLKPPPRGGGAESVC